MNYLVLISVLYIFKNRRFRCLMENCADLFDDLSILLGTGLGQSLLKSQVWDILVEAGF